MTRTNSQEAWEELKQINRIKKYDAQRTYPFNELDDRSFELLLYQLANQEGFLGLNYDKCGLMAGVREKGRDIILSKDSIIVGVVQCKNYQRNITKKDLIKEIVKFLCYYVEDSTLIPDINEFTYVFAVAKGFSNDATEFVNNKKYINIENLEIFIKDCLKENRTMKIQYNDNLKKEVEKIIRLLNIELLIPTDLTNLINKQPTIRDQFFETEKVVDRKAFEEIIHGTVLDIEKFYLDYSKAIINNHSRINFFGLALPKKPREVQLYSLFVEPTFKIKNSIEKKSSFNKEINNKFLTYGHDLYHVIDDYKPSKQYNKSFDFILSSILREAISGAADAFKDSLLFEYVRQGRPVFDSVYRDENSESIPFRKLFDEIDNKNLVILGKPGAGKSSLIKYILCKFMSKEKDIFDNSKIQERVPFRIELNKYNKFKMQTSSGILEYLIKFLEKDYQLNYVNRKFMLDLFSKKETILFFDGLDEILDVQERLEVRNDIENFLSNNFRVLGIVTSRYESYEEVYFKESEFKILEVNDFSDSQMKTYIEKWYSIEEDEEAQRTKEISGCLEELEKVENELKTNPLLLTLILILYRNELELPTSKWDLYESCTNTLVETRDNKEKKIEFALQISNKIATFSSLAYWQYTNMESNNLNINYELSQKYIKDYLITKGEFEYENEAEQAAEGFLEFAKVRSIYVENAFTHKTFLEYFTAYYIYTNTHGKSNPEKRDEIIEKYIGESSWKVILELLICKIDKEQPDFETIDLIISKHLSKPQGIIFFLQILKYLRNISPKMINRIFSEASKKLVCDYEVTSFREVKQLNKYLSGLLKIQRFNKAGNLAIEKLNDELKEEHYKYYYLFLLENDITSNFITKGNMNFKKAMDEEPLIFIQNNTQLLISEEEYYKVMKKFIEKYGIYNTLKTYKPKFNDTIVVNGETSFNWVITALFSQGGHVNFIRNSNNLIKLGVSYKQMKTAIYKSSGNIGVSQEELESYLKYRNTEPVKNLILTALKHYYKVSNKNSNIQPFYKDFLKKR